MLCHTGLLVDLEGDWRIYEVERTRDRGVFRIGCHLYDEQFQPVSPDAPQVLEAIDPHSGWKQHKKGRAATLARWRERMAKGKAEEARQRLMASDESWKHDRPLRSFNKLHFLAVACVRVGCGRVRYDQIGHVCDEGRFGNYTAAQVELGFRCAGCRGEIRITISEG